MGIGDSKSGLVWVKESRTSVLVMILRIPKKQNKKKSQTKYRKTKGESRATKDDSSKYAVSLY